MYYNKKHIKALCGTQTDTAPDCDQAWHTSLVYRSVQVSSLQASALTDLEPLLGDANLQEEKLFRQF